MRGVTLIRAIAILMVTIVLPITAGAATVSSPVISSTYAQMTQGVLVGTQGDGPSSIYPGGAYSLASHWDTVRGGIKHTLMSGSLNNPYNSVAWLKPTCVRDASGYCTSGTSGAPAFTAFDNGLADVVELWFLDFYWPSPGVTPEVLALIHEERVGYSGGTPEGFEGKTRIGLGWSSDNGNTWTYLGRIISPYGDPQPFNIQGAPYIVKDGYFYVYYVDNSEVDTKGHWGIGVSRASVSDVIAAARAGNLGTNLWFKYNNGQWAEPSLGGKPSFPTNQWGITHTQAVHSSYTGKFYMPLTFMAWPVGAGYINTSVKLYESTDGLSWVPSVTLVDEPAVTQGSWGGYQYCSLAGIDGNANHEVDQKFYVYCLKYKQSLANHDEYAQYRWTVDLGPSVDNYRQSAGFTSQQGPIWFYQYGAGFTDMTWNTDGYWQGSEIFDRIYSNTMHPGETEGPLLKWTASKAGTVLISGTVRDADPSCGDGITAQLKHNGTSIFQGTILNGDTVGKSHNLLRTVAAGDSLSFTVGSNANNFCDSTYWDPSIVYAPSWKASSGFSSTQGQSQWYYQYKVGSSFYDMTWDSVNSWWQGNETYSILGSSWQHPGANSDSARKWVAPNVGSVRITGTVKDDNGSCGDGVTASILKNGTVVWGSQNIANGNATGFTHDVTVNVAIGDAIHFIVNAAGNNWCDSTGWNPSITYQ